MLSGATWSAAAIVGTAVFRIVVSSDSMKNATAISHGSRRWLESDKIGSGATGTVGLGGLRLGGLGDICFREGGFFKHLMTLPKGRGTRRKHGPEAPKSTRKETGFRGQCFCLW